MYTGTRREEMCWIQSQAHLPNNPQMPSSDIPSGCICMKQLGIRNGFFIQYNTKSTKNSKEKKMFRWRICHFPTIHSKENSN